MIEILILISIFVNYESLDVTEDETNITNYSTKSSSEINHEFCTHLLKVV